jgi:cell division protein FtsW
MVYSASAALAMNRFNQPYFFLVKQAMWAALGLAAMSVAMRFDYRNYRQPSFIWASLGFVVLALVAVLFSAPINGSRRWFGVGGFGVQPSELAKLSAIFFIAALLERRMHPSTTSRTRSSRSASSSAGSWASSCSSRISARR